MEKKGPNMINGLDNFVFSKPVINLPATGENIKSIIKHSDISKMNLDLHRGKYEI